MLLRVLHTTSLSLSPSPSQNGRRGDEGGSHPDAADDLGRQRLGAAHLGVGDGPGDGEEAVDADGHQGENGGGAEQHVERDPGIAQHPAKQPRAWSRRRRLSTSVSMHTSSIKDE